MNIAVFNEANKIWNNIAKDANEQELSFL